MPYEGLKGNKWSQALQTPEDRQKAYKSLCEHLAKGYPARAWSFREGELKCSWKTMLSYLEKYPTEFDAFLKEESEAKSHRDWFDLGRDLSKGEVKGNPSPQTYALIMRNMFEWDREVRQGTIDLDAFKKVRDFLLEPSKSPSSHKDDAEDRTE